MDRFRRPSRIRVASVGAALAFALGASAIAAERPAPPFAGAEAPVLLAPAREPDFGPIEGAPLLLQVLQTEVARTPASATAATQAFSADFVPIVALAGIEPGDAAAPTPPDKLDAPPARAGASTHPASPDPTPTALAAALDRLILHEGGANPLGAGDWRAARAAIGSFYAERGFRPLWVDAQGLTPAGRSAVDQTARASDDGLDLGAFAPPARLSAFLSPEQIATAEVAIAAAIVVYAEQATGSRVPPSRVSRLVTTEPVVADPGSALAETAAAPDPGARLADFNPPQKGYRSLRDELKRLATTGGAVAALDLGSTPELLADDDGGAGAPRLAGARVKGFARKAAYVASADPQRSGAAVRERSAIVANMEMWRWEPRDMGERRIEVNVPDFTASVMEGDAVIHRARVVVGKPATPTPIFSDVMRYVLINPSWQVPDSIIKKEMMSKLDSLSRHGYEVKTVNGQLTVRQLPGERNALGRLAFMFPNEHSVYLHDTPSQALFGEDARAFSHGCVRVEDPVHLAELVLGWPEARITAAFGTRERTVFLPQPLPIHIEYFTEFVDDSGDLRERPDLYGLTKKVADTLSSTRQD